MRESKKAVGDTEQPAGRSAGVRAWRWVGRTGLVLMAIGVLALGLLAYQLWGTGIGQASDQRALRTEFERELAATTSPPTSSDTRPVVPSISSPPSETTRSTASQPATSTTSTATSTTVAPRPQLIVGDPVARLEIPSIGVDQIVVEGVGHDQLESGPGHYADTPLPGEFGNAAIAGHRTTYGAPFLDLGDLVPGDEIVVTTIAGRYVYRVTASTIVSPSDVYVVGPLDGYHLTLTTCHPKYSTRQRLVISAELVTDAPAGWSGL